MVQKISNGDKMKKSFMKEIKKYTYLLILLLSTLSIFLFNYTYISITIAIASIILGIIFLKKHPKVLTVTIIISLITGFLNSLIIYSNIEKTIDVNKDRNVLLGKWEYNTDGGIYKFKDDNTYYQYINKDQNDNYCKGTYTYKYGVTNNKETLRGDDKYTYYTLFLKENYCVIKGKKFNDNYEKMMYLSIDKFSGNEIIMMNKETEKLITLKKVITD